MSPILRLTGISKAFPGVQALDDVSFDVVPGEVHAIMGENGAGKSTLMKIAAGVYPPDAGMIEIQGREVAFKGPKDAADLGLHTVFQELTVLENLDVGRNVMIGDEPVAFGGLWLDLPALYARAQHVLDRLDIDLDSRTPLSGLSTGARQMVEIARACAETPKVLVLDEPTSSLGRQEEDLLFQLIRRLKGLGVGIVYISHRMSEIFRLADRITVLRDGRHVATGAAADLDRASLIRAMVGRDVDETRHGVDVEGLPVALAARGITWRGAVRGVDLDLHAGEVLGLAGLMGAGRTEFARLVAGAERPDAGTFHLFGRPFAPPTVGAAVRTGVVYVPEDRKGQGLVLSLPVGDNIALPSLRRFTRAGLLAVPRIGSMTRDWMLRMGVKAASDRVPVETLSGGNQQKVVLAKWLSVEPKVILLDEPTRGVDVGAKAEIHKLVRKLAQDGAAVLAISSELPELLTVSDRIAVMAQGRIVGVVPATEATEAGLLDLALAEGQAA
ncbi:MAG: sugar ABC transporter ATP-binding protein [Boseongicola sp. SB0664_bin_43]|uniref:Sugar ABC transporter ATP-binding protein n=1 Tax=Boseongicola sp. SB0664_bin_43 TaxID=2604844 RepID=A0A6B0XZ19_9RHOB|nr:sugar ABC transporter ATP-binding protein [Boseongicola sp. SB0664_bin_43]MYK33393.1 sugar ABC transporter ATP-binding protein [Boseongicola sp. SB0670_bin_30]